MDLSGENVLVIASLLWLGALGAGPGPACFSEAFGEELLERSARDQAARRAFIEGGMKPGEHRAILEIDLGNTAWLRAVIQGCGWPPRSTVGEDGAVAAWLIAQHADATPEFQVEAAAAMMPRVIQGEASAERLALLVDRHARLQNIPQTYGMQYDIVDGRIRFLPIDAPAALDARRVSVGLPTFACHVVEIERRTRATAEWPEGLARVECPGP